jgi:hypothetical protein
MAILEGFLLILLLFFWVIDSRRSSLRKSRLYNFEYFEESGRTPENSSISDMASTSLI